VPSVCRKATRAIDADLLALDQRRTYTGIDNYLMGVKLAEHLKKLIIVLRRGRKVADKPIADTSPEEVTGLITGAIEREAATIKGALDLGASSPTAKGRTRPEPV